MTAFIDTTDTTTEVTDDADEHDTPETPETGSQTAQDEPEGAAAVDDPDDAQGDEQASKKRGVRQKLKDAEVANEKLTAAVARARESLIDAAMDRAAVPADKRRALLRVIGDDELNECLDDDGLPDAELLLATVEAARAELGLPRKPQPNSVVGHGRSGKTDDELPKDFAGVLRAHVASSGMSAG
ncbi:hypothetical protein [Mycolicibacterium sp. XJ879]